MVNIFLIPYTAFRLLPMALWCAVGGLLSWWLVLTAIVKGGLNWPPSLDGPLLVAAVACGVTLSSLVGEANLRRWTLWSRVWRSALGAGAAFGLTMLLYTLWEGVGLRLVIWLLELVLESLGVSASGLSDDASDSSLVSLSYRFGAFATGGLASGLAAGILRKFKGMLSHLFGGLAAGLAAGGAWWMLGADLKYLSFGDLYIAGAGMGLTWGFVFGLLTWGIPDELYSGWLRVVSDYRHGRRIPVDAPDGGSKERFVGHFPRGLDLYLPPQEGVMELHVSVAVNRDRTFKARGLTLQPTMVKRFLEQVNLRYDPSRAAPVEARLQHGDRIELGEGETQAQLEFIMLPREEA